jgi:hypothetical protein
MTLSKNNSFGATILILLITALCNIKLEATKNFSITLQITNY